jgi:pimeloyl-ACP methyl ester carboxylesterase
MKIEDSYVDFGGNGPVLLFLHANAYPPECYRKFLSPITDRYRIIAPIQRPLWPGQCPEQLTSWKLFRDDLIDFMTEHSMEGVKVIGHSLGAVASLWASIENPALFSKLILIDPVIMNFRRVVFSRILPHKLRRKYIPIVRIALRRRDTWESREAMMKHLGSKRVFQRFDDDAFLDYVKYGVTDSEHGVTLRFPKAWEARIYSTPPNMWPHIKKSKVPMTIVKAEYSDVITAGTWTQIKKRIPSAEFLEVPSVGHLFPFEKPKELSELVIQYLDT